jgi:hypothetical protein
VLRCLTRTTASCNSLGKLCDAAHTRRRLCRHACAPILTNSTCVTVVSPCIHLWYPPAFDLRRSASVTCLTSMTPPGGAPWG